MNSINSNFPDHIMENNTGFRDYFISRRTGIWMFIHSYAKMENVKEIIHSCKLDDILDKCNNYIKEWAKS